MNYGQDLQQLCPIRHFRGLFGFVRTIGLYGRAKEKGNQHTYCFGSALSKYLQTIDLGLYETNSYFNCHRHSYRLVSNESLIRGFCI